MTDKRNEMQFDTCPFCKKQPIRNPQYPKDFVQCDNGGECPIYGYEIPLKMWPISPPLPDDVAEAVKRIVAVARTLNSPLLPIPKGFTEDLMLLTRAASTPSATCYSVQFCDEDFEIVNRVGDVLVKGKCHRKYASALGELITSTPSAEVHDSAYLAGARAGWNAALIKGDKEFDEHFSARIKSLNLNHTGGK